MPKENKKELIDNTEERITVFDQIKFVVLNHLEEEGLYDPETGKINASEGEISQIVGELCAAGAISTIETLGRISPDDESRFIATVSMGGILKTYAEHDAKVDSTTRERYGEHVDPQAGQKRNELTRTAFTDETTGLPNGKAFRAASNEVDEVEGKENRKPTGDRVIVMIDINNFKAFNDRYGHASGNVALSYVARELKRIVKQTLSPDDDEFEASNVFRLHGDEFVVLCNPTEAEILKDRIVSEFGQQERFDNLIQKSEPENVQLPSGQELGLINWGGIPISLSAGVGETTLEADEKMLEMKPEVHAQFPEFVRK